MDQKFWVAQSFDCLDGSVGGQITNGCRRLTVWPAGAFCHARGPRLNNTKTKPLTESRTAEEMHAAGSAMTSSSRPQSSYSSRGDDDWVGRAGPPWAMVNGSGAQGLSVCRAAPTGPGPHGHWGLRAKVPSDPRVFGWVGPGPGPDSMDTAAGPASEPQPPPSGPLVIGPLSPWPLTPGPAPTEDQPADPGSPGRAPGPGVAWPKRWKKTKTETS